MLLLGAGVGDRDRNFWQWPGNKKLYNAAVNGYTSSFLQKTGFPFFTNDLLRGYLH